MFQLLASTVNLYRGVPPSHHGPNLQTSRSAWHSLTLRDRDEQLRVLCYGFASRLGRHLLGCLLLAFQDFDVLGFYGLIMFRLTV